MLANRLTFASPRGELTLLFLTSCAVVFVLLLAIALGEEGWLSSTQSRAILFTCLALGLALGGVGLLSLPSQTGGRDRAVESELARTTSELRTARAAIDAEPQVAVFWDRGQPPRVLVHSLKGIAGLPDDPTLITRPGLWLDTTSAQDLQQAIELLIRDGRAFTLLVSTQAGVPLEADGRAAGGRVLLRLRDVAGFKRDVVRLLDQHRVIKRETTTTRALLDAMPMPVWLTGADGRITWANAAYMQVSGAVTRREIEGGTVDLLDTRQRRKIEAATASGTAFRERLPLIVGGEMKAHDLIVVPADGCTAGIAMDAAALEGVKGAIERQTAAYDRTLHRVATGVAIYGRDQRLTFFNDAYRKIWELDANWLSSHPSIEETIDRLRSLNRLPAVPNFRDWKAKVLTGFRSESSYEDWWHLNDGRTIHVTGELRPDGGATYLYDDVTEQFSQRSRVEEMLETRTETLNSLKEGVAVFRPDGCLDLHNPVFANIWRLSHERLKEHPHVDEIIGLCRPLFDDDRTWDLIKRAVTAFTERRTAQSDRMSRTDGSVIDYTIAPLPDGGTLVTFTDVTDRRRYEQALLERNQALAQADIDKNQLLGHVSYELRTPLNNIIGFTELLQNQMIGALNDKQREYLSDIAASSKSLQALIDDVLDLQAIDAGGLELKITPSAVRPIVDAAVRSVRERAKRANVAIEATIAADVDTIVADASRVRHVLYHLMSNAIGFSKPREVVKVSVWREGGMVAFAVEDRGVGVPQDQQAKVFERFESRSHGSKHRGAGNGLAIVKSLVELHGGNVAFVSEPGRGTRVTVRFPESGIGG